MTTREKMTLSPLAKFRRFGRFPVKLTLHVVIMVLVVVQINLLAQQFTPYSRAAQRVFERLFVPRQPLVSVKATVDWMNRSVSEYYEFPTTSVNRWLLVDTRDSSGRPPASAADPPPVLMDVVRYTGNPYNPETQRFNFSRLPVQRTRFECTRTSLGPFDGLAPDRLREYIYSLITVTTFMGYVNVESGVLGAVPVLWNVTLSYDFSSDGGEVGVNLLAVPSVLPPDSPVTGGTRSAYDTLTPTVWVAGVLAGLAAISLILSVKELVQGYLLYRRTRALFPKGVKLKYAATADVEHHQNQHLHLHNGRRPSLSAAAVVVEEMTTWDDVPLDIKMQFFSSWALVTVFGSVSVIMSSAYGVGTTLGLALSGLHHLWLGLGAALYSISFLRYAEFSDRMYTLSLTVKFAGIRVFRMLVSVMPAFMGYILFGTVVFSRYSTRFSTMDQTAVSLFALLNGDDIHATFDDLHTNFPYHIIARVYLYTFIAFFITTVLNIFIFIIEDAFTAAKDMVWGVGHHSSSQSTDDNDADEDRQLRPFDVRSLFDMVEKKEKLRRQQRKRSSPAAADDDDDDNDGPLSINS